VKRALLTGAVALLVVHAPPLSAQDLSVRVGGLHTRYADSLTGTAGSFAGRLVFDGPRLRVGSSFSVAQFSTGHSAVQFGASALALRALGAGRAWSGGVLTQLSGSWLQHGTLSGVATAGPVLAAASGPWLGWIAGEGGAVRRLDGRSDALFGGTLHLNVDLGAWGLDASGSATRAGLIRYADFTFGIDGRAGPVSGGVLAGARSGGLGGGPWAQARAAWRVARSVALEVEGGKYPADISGFTHGLFVTAGVRVGLTRGALDPRRGRARSGSDALRVERAGRGLVRLVFRVPGARAVALAGEWNGWESAPLTMRADGRWETVVPLAPGAYRFSLVVDGELWTVPSGVPTMPDDFGGQVGLLVVGG
jgi:hypothetical protein